MLNLDTNSTFIDAYLRLKGISLNPARHAATNAYEHCEQVRQRVSELVRLNDCTDDETALLEDLARLHDIGKVTGSANPTESVALLPSFGISDETIISLVKYHDVNLPWFISAQRGEPAGDKAWAKLARTVDVRLLSLFMVADRVDCPGGWRANAPLVWFLEQATNRQLLTPDLILNDGPEVTAQQSSYVERSAGAILVRGRGDSSEALLIRVRRDGYEVPKGHIEGDETEVDAAIRELREETALVSTVRETVLAGTISYALSDEVVPTTKTVTYYVAFIGEDEEPVFDTMPKRTKELRWVKPAELQDVALVNEDLRPIIEAAFRTALHRED